MERNTVWEAIKAYYISCRSYKRTAEEFGMNPETIKTRARREGWRENCVSEKVQRGVKLEGQDEPRAPEKVQRGVRSEGQDEPRAPEKVQDEPHEHSLPSICLPCLANFSAHAVEMLDIISAGKTLRSRESFRDKEAFKAHLACPQTKDILYSGVLGENPGMRVGRNNPATRLLAVVADYDLPISNEKRSKYLSKLPTPPNFIESSFSGGTHAVWLLEHPIPLMAKGSGDGSLLGEEYNQALLDLIASELKLNRGFGEPDKVAFRNFGQYYAFGRGLNVLSTTPVITAERCEYWVVKALRKAGKGNKASVPLELVAREVERRFPGRWNGPFEKGARGVRFWDSLADSPGAAIVTEEGMVCFTGPYSFRSWRDIFGPAFVEESEAATLGRVKADCYYIDGKFWRKDINGVWYPYSQQAFIPILRAGYGLSGRGGENGEASEVEQALDAISTCRRLGGVAPLIYNRNEVVDVGGRLCLNISRVRALEPAVRKKAADPQAGAWAGWGEAGGFPWIGRFLVNLLDRDDAPLQLEHYLSWLAHAYQGALAYAPRRGQAVYMAGPAGCGKTFLSTRILSPLFGGHEEATAYLTSETRFNDTLFEHGLLTIDDAELVAYGTVHSRYSALVKKLVANNYFMCEAKFRKAVKLPWVGRLVVTCNTDPESLKILPSIDINNHDKLMFFLCREGFKLNDPEAEKKAQEELPAFAAFLADYRIPDETKGDVRFGVKSFMHPDLVAEAKGSGLAGTFEDLFESFLNNYFKANPDATELRGTASEIYEQMSAVDTMRESMKGIVAPRSIGTFLGQLKAKEDSPIDYSRTNTKRTWFVTRESFIRYRSRREEDTPISEQNGLLNEYGYDEGNIPF